VSPVRGVSPLAGVQPAQSAERAGLDSVSGFADSLDALLRSPARPAQARASSDISFSRHASARMESRGIQLDEQDMEDLGTAVDNLAKRGAKESLVLMGDHAFIVGVPDRRIVTVMTRSEAAGNIFTQIDSTAVVR
jgi:flagellar operon protein